MSNSQARQTEAIAVFKDADSLQSAIDSLLSGGFDRAELSLLASEDAIESKLGHVYRRSAELEDEPEAPRTAFVSKESIGDAEGALVGGLTYVGALAAAGAIVASGGSAAAVIGAVALAGSAGAAIGGLLAGLLGKEEAEKVEEQLNHGGLLLWVRTRDRDHEDRAMTILRLSGGTDCHLHKIPSVAA